MPGAGDDHARAEWVPATVHQGSIRFREGGRDAQCRRHDQPRASVRGECQGRWCRAAHLHQGEDAGRRAALDRFDRGRAGVEQVAQREIRDASRAGATAAPWRVRSTSAARPRRRSGSRTAGGRRGAPRATSRRTASWRRAPRDAVNIATAMSKAPSAKAMCSASISSRPRDIARGARRRRVPCAFSSISRDRSMPTTCRSRRYSGRARPVPTPTSSTRGPARRFTAATARRRPKPDTPPKTVS